VAAPTSFTVRHTRINGPLAGVEDCNPDAHGFCASAQDAANFDLVYDGDERTPVVDSGGDPTMSLGHVAKVDAAVVKRHGVIVALIGVARMSSIGSPGPIFS
jgi:hypothetical protein